MLRKIGSILIFLYSGFLFAQDVGVEVIPKNPVANETFKVVFKVKGSEAEIPSISFNPVNVEVLGRDNQGITTRTTYINGKLSISREVKIVYELIAAKPGFARLDDIIVNVAGKRLAYNNLRLNIVKKSKAVDSNYFVVAVPNKQKAYVGESILVDYYVYSKTSAPSREIRKFPKLKDFVKRFIQKNERVERVSYNGQIYYRSLMYSAQLFPSKAGTAILDPITVRIQYAKRRNDPFGAFSFGFRSLKNKTLVSKPVEIEVVPLPSAGKTNNFTGLVGNHDFRLKINKEKYLANEPIEVTLEVKGEGLLENFDAPKIFDTKNIEEFETSVDLKLTKTQSATKIFKYTFLGRNNYTSPSKNLEFTYFDTYKGQYITRTLTVPEVIIRGGASSSNQTPVVTQKESSGSEKVQVSIPKVEYKASIVAPFFENVSANKDKISIINYILGILCMAFILFEGFSIYRKRHVKNTFEKNLALIKSGNVSYKTIYRTFYPFTHGKNSISETLNLMELSDSAKNAFKSVIEEVETHSYAKNKSKMTNHKIKESYLSELKQLFENENNI